MSRILVADDELTIRELLSAVLTDEGYEVVTAANGKQALDLARSVNPDVIIMDIMMPIMDGREAVERMAAAGAPPPQIILMSAVPGLVNGEQRYPHLVKPFDLDMLLQTVETVLRDRLH